MPTLSTFNANNFFLRYRFAGTYPGDASEKSAVAAAEVGTLGYVPGKSFGKYKKDEFIIWDPRRRALAAQALAEPDGNLPDILCLQEVENLDAIRRFNDDHLDKHYRYMLLIDGWDTRNIDVGVLSVFPIVDVRSHIDDAAKNGDRIFSRDCLVVTFELPGKERFTVLVNHLKSKFVETRGKTKAQVKKARRDGHKDRLSQAEYVEKLVESRFKGEHDTALYAVVGDFNDTEESPFLKPLLRSKHLVDVIARTRPADDRWTYYWRSQGRVQQIDFILASKALAARVNQSHIERAGLSYRQLNAAGEILPAEATLTHFDEEWEIGGPQGFTPDRKVDFRFLRYEPIFDNVADNVSDHCPVKIWF